MNLNSIKEVIGCLGEERFVFSYAKDFYALYLLEHFCLAKGMNTVKAIKSSPYAKLLSRPLVRSLMSGWGNGQICKEQLQQGQALAYGDNEHHSTVLSLGKWGGEEDYYWSQTTLPGYNLVLQVNLCGQHDERLRWLKVEADAFKYSGHPIHELRNTLAWVRMDFDLDTGEALIEEVQSDWLRMARNHQRHAQRVLAQGRSHYRASGEKYHAESMLTYTRKVLADYQGIWQELSLCAAIQFLTETIGIDTIFYHSHAAGAFLKRIEWTLPPKSLYTQLPRQFCFQATDSGPNFVVNHRKMRRKMRKLGSNSWFKLANSDATMIPQV